jgi:XTP/dITP diphosphohydrolase
MDLLIATTNAGKLHEYESLLADVPLRLLTLKDVGLDTMMVEENATTVEENAEIKAQAYVRASGLLTLADDTGLLIDALGGAPGVYPARYGGEGLTMAQRRQKVLGELAGVPDEQRTARFVCVIVLADPQTMTTTRVKGVCEGRIAQVDDEGGHGFGYDAVFIPQGYDTPWSRMALEDKNRLSHRGQAARQIIPVLERFVRDRADK